ncbi:Protein of unknown function [Faunimonas pinastri]|uniref:DUF2852 domain-containing protein n=1 Tax=Faunimonas pinastri TaxID=1855383 RepID=A0A1H9PSF4_9HYPH|nr:DUF2852 domain-containing protein [Faunimonas pinastri]SER51256.1 Protein of unknown function [Faunimonas pinastri]
MTYNDSAGRACFSRGRWKPLNIVLMVAGFAIFWPLGLAMLAYIIWGDELGRRTSDFRSQLKSQFGSFGSGFGTRRGGNAFWNTGNVAFDEYREREIRRLEEERRKVEEMRTEFESFLRELRRAKDKEEFERFMSEYRNRTSGGSAGSGPQGD